MANEIQFSISLSVSKNGATNQSSLGQTQTMAGTNIIKKTFLALSAGWNAIGFDTVTGVPAKYALKNLDAANYIELATDNAGANKFAKIPTGDGNLISPSSGTIYIKANTANVLCELCACES